MDNTIQLYVDKKKEIKGYPITSPDRVIDENGVNIKEKLDNIVSQLPNDLATKDYVDEAINNAQLGGGDAQVDLSVYAKKTDLHAHSNKTILDSITTSKVNQWDSKSDFNGDYNDLTNKPAMPTKTSQLTNDSGFITSIPNEYVTETELNNKGYLTQHQDLSSYAKKTDLHSHTNKTVLNGITSAKITEWDNKSTFDGNYNSLTNKPTIPTKVSDLTNDGGYLTSIPSEYVTESELNSKGYLTEHQDISGKVDKINGYSLVSDAEISRLATLENYDDTEVRESINETNTSLDNIANRVTTLETNGGGSNLNLRDVVDGEIFKLYGTSDIPSEPIITYGEIILNKNSLSITEEKTDTFTVKLDKAPTNNQVVTLNKNNSDVTLSSYSLTFTPSNYSTVQTVTITVAEDNDEYSNETCTITLSSPNVSTKTLIVNITDNDEEVIEPEEPDTPDVPSSATLIHEWDLTETGSTIEDKVNNLDLLVNGNNKQISRYDNYGELNENFILTETESFSLDILVTPASVYEELILHTGHMGGFNIYKGLETNHYRFLLKRNISYGTNKGLLSIEYRLNPDGSEKTTIENTQTAKDVQTNIKIVYNADKTEFKIYQEDNLVYTDNRPYKISGFNFVKADYCKVYKGCII